MGLTEPEAISTAFGKIEKQHPFILGRAAHQNGRQEDIDRSTQIEGIGESEVVHIPPPACCRPPLGHELVVEINCPPHGMCKKEGAQQKPEVFHDGLFKGLIRVKMFNSFVVAF